MQMFDETKIEKMAKALAEARKEANAEVFEMADITHIIKAMFTDSERYKLSDVLQNYYCEGLKEIAEEDETIKSIMQKVGLINE